ncbi:MAG: cytochrome c [Flavobacteriales bacterium]|nr:cytochrome c [Flavobacteriales bacterium]
MNRLKAPKTVNQIATHALLGVVVVMGMASCGQDPTRKYDESQKHTTPRIEYTAAMDMYRSPSYETYSTNPVFADSMSAQKPVAGTVARGHLPYAYPNTKEGYELAGQQLKNPIPLSPKVLEEGQDLFVKYCSHCHGATGMGDGKMIKNDRFPPPPAYSSEALKNLSEGKMYHSITYGKNLMPNHATQLYPEERWKIIHFIQTLQGPKTAEVPAEGGATGTQEATPVPAEQEAAPAESTQNG